MQLEVDLIGHINISHKYRRRYICSKTLHQALMKISYESKTAREREPVGDFTLTITAWLSCEQAGKP